MKRKQFTKEHTFRIPEGADAGVVVTESCRKHGASSATNYAWKANFACLEVSDGKHLRLLEEENAWLERQLDGGGDHATA